jgi:tetratricopeptide (TPR) repeat protein
MLATIGLAWFLVVILPVSHLVVPAGVMLAERTLYLPSVGLAFAVAAIGSRVIDRDRLRPFVAVMAVLCAAYALRSAWRVPVWNDTESVLASLESSHPESHIVIRAQAIRAMEQGRYDDARAGFERALQLQPLHFALLTEVAQFEAIAGRPEVAERLARRAIDVYPTSPHGYAVLGRVLRLTENPTAARSALLEGMRVADPLAPIWTELERLRAPTEDRR